MSAEILRRAASLMRERAEAADAGPWTQDSQVRGDTVIFNAEGEWVTNVTSGRTYAENIVTFDHEVANGEHIASWHPAVALAVADWLATEAAEWEVNFLATQAPSRGIDQPPALHYGDPEGAAKNADYHARRALAVARAYLGGAA